MQLQGHGQLERVGVEGTGSYGSGLLAFLRGQGVVCTEVNRPNRQSRRRGGKSDTADAEAAARATLAGEATCVPKTQDGRSKRCAFCGCPELAHMIRKGQVRPLSPGSQADQFYALAA